MTQPRSPLPAQRVETCDYCQGRKGEGRIGYNVEPGHALFGQTFPCPKCNQRASVAASGLKTHETGVTLDSLATVGRPGAGKMKQAAARFIRKPRGFLSFFGGTGNGKTIAAMAIVNACLEHGIQAQYVTAKGLMDYLREAFDPKIPESDAGRIRKLARIPVLVIDEFADVRNSEYTAEMQRYLVNERYRDANVLGTVFCWNYTWKDLPWPSVVSRLQEFDFVENNDIDLRPRVGAMKQKMSAQDNSESIFDMGENERAAVFERGECA